MSIIGNILWTVFIGWWSAIGWAFFGLLWCLPIVTIPIARQCFKMARLSMLPFGKELRDSDSTVSLLINIIWIFCGGLELATSYAVAGLICCVTIIGIPFGKQCFKLAHLSLLPFGTEIL